MKRLSAFLGACLSLVLFAGTNSWAEQKPASPEKPRPAEAAESVDHANAYYHYMLARRLQELAGINNRGDYLDRAIDEFKKAMAADPDSLFLRVELAELYFRMGRIADAVRDCEAVLASNPDQVDAHRLLAHIYWRNLGQTQPDPAAKESLEKAIQHFEALSRLDPKDSDNDMVLGRLYRLNNQNDKAEELYKKILNGSPNSKAAVDGLAQLYFDHGDFDQVVEIFKKIPVEDLDTRQLGMMAFSLQQEHDFEGAITLYEKSLAGSADNQDIRRAYADALASAGRYAAARTELQKIIRLQPEDGLAHLRLGQILRQEGRFDEARKELDRAKVLLPESVEVPFQQVMLEDAAGNEDKAIEIMQGLVQQTEKADGQYTLSEAANRAIFLERLGMIYRSQEKFDKAIETFKQAGALGGEQAARSEALVVETLRLNRQPQKALEEATAALQKYPKDRALRTVHATLLGEQGKVDEAVQDLRSMLADSPADREIYLTIAQVYSQGKRFDDAEAAALKSLELSKTAGEQEYPHFVLGSIFERQKKYDQAEQHFQEVLKANPLNAAAFNYLGYMLADRGVRLDESVKLIQKALEIEPSNGAYLDSLGWAYYKMSKFDLAAPNLEKAAKMISGDPTIQEHLGYVYLDMGKPREAQAAWEKALEDWHTAVSSEFDADQAAKLKKKLDELKSRHTK